MGDHMTKTQNYKIRIEENRQQITNMLSGANTHKRLNNLNWIAHELSTEAEILFQCQAGVPKNKRRMYLDYTSMMNLNTAWKYVLNHTKEPIDNAAIRKIHQLLAHNTDVPGGQYRLVEVCVLQSSAPSYNDMLYRMNDIEYNLANPNVPVLTRAFNVHYDIIAAQPFRDFNKRTARLIMNWLLIQGGYRPIVFNQRTDKQKYKDAITAKAAGDTKKYTQYMYYSCLLRTQNEIINLLKKSRVL